MKKQFKDFPRPMIPRPLPNVPVKPSQDTPEFWPSPAKWV